MARIYGVGIVGLGWVSGEYIKACAQEPRTEVAALCSRSRQKATERAAQFGLAAQAYDDYDAMLADPRVDIVIICTPDNLHAPMAIKAARAGKHVVIEKPVATTPQDLYALDAEVRKSGVKSIVGFVLHWLPEVVTMKALIDNGHLGSVFYAECDYWNNITGWWTGYEWARTREAGGSAWTCSGCHAVNTLTWLVGDITEASCYASTNGPGMQDYEYNPTEVAIFKFANGAVGKVCVSFELISPYIMNFDLLGTQATLRDNTIWAPRLFPGQKEYATIPTIMSNTAEVTHHPFREEVAHFLDCIVDDTESHASLHKALNSHEACFAAEVSVRDGRPVRIADLRAGFATSAV
jgi:predicted dehydrogenase